MFEWDEEKRQATIRKHGIDFVDAAEVFANDHLLLVASSDIEQRQIAVGYINEVYIAAIFTMREGRVRIITARKARRDEREQYQAHVARRDAQNQKPD